MLRLRSAAAHRQEYFADYVPVTASLFSLNFRVPPQRIWSTSPAQWDAAGLERHVSGVLSMLLSLKKRPVVRYERMSALAKKLAEEVTYQTNSAQAPLFDFRRTEVPPLLLILDRRNDPVTPLLTQWTYQAMVHGLLGINNGRTSLAGTPGARPETSEIVLSVDHDPFFAANLYNNFGDLGAAIKEYVVQFQSRTTSSSSIETIQDMKRFVEEYPEFQRLRGNVSKHVALLGELSRRVEQDRLLQVSELEQSLASKESHASDLRNLQELLASDAIGSSAKLRLAILYALRFQKWAGNQIDSVAQQLLRAGVPERDVLLMYIMLNFAGAEQRQDDLFSNENFFSRGKSALKGLTGVDNVYTQHTPHLVQTVDNLMRGRLRTSSYPFAGERATDDGAPATVAPGGPTTRPQDVILFIIGGATYEEARSIALLNGMPASSMPGANAVPPAWPGTTFLLGGTTVHNSRSFLEMVQHTAAQLPASIAVPRSGASGGGGTGLGDVATGARGLATDLLDRVRRGVEGMPFS